MSLCLVPSGPGCRKLRVTGRTSAAGSARGAVGQRELQQSVCVHLVEEFELGGQLMGLLPLGGELGALAVVVVVRQLLARVGVPAKGPEAVQVNLVTHGGRQRVHQDARAQALWRQLLGFPVAVGYNEKTQVYRPISSLLKPSCRLKLLTDDVIFQNGRRFDVETETVKTSRH